MSEFLHNFLLIQPRPPQARNKTVEAVTREHGYIKEGDKEKLHNRLRRIEGQVRGIQRMVEEEAYCVDILTQIGSVVSASEKVATIVLRDHVEHCVRESIEKGESADEKIEELTAAVERFLRV
jgi:DNA-binding FrmR family transcriptional regulator